MPNGGTPNTEPWSRGLSIVLWQLCLHSELDILSHIDVRVLLAQLTQLYDLLLLLPISWGPRYHLPHRFAVFFLVMSKIHTLLFFDEVYSLHGRFLVLLWEK